MVGDVGGIRGCVGGGGGRIKKIIWRGGGGEAQKKKMTEPIREIKLGSGDQ